MSEITYKCTECKKDNTFESNGVKQLFLDDNTPRPATYIVNCTHCNAENSVTKDNGK